jgi:hypothetical protein
LRRIKTVPVLRTKLIYFNAVKNNY